MNVLKIILLLWATLALYSCKKEKHPHTFYYWRTNLHLNSAEQNALKKAEIPKLYCRFFDVDKIEGTFRPIAIISKDSLFKTQKEIVPVVFIKNEIFYSIKEQEIDSLSIHIYRLIQQTAKGLDLNLTNEIQIDCDWTENTKEPYFQFLQKFKKLNENLSCTLRLHQVAEKEKVGIPPVSKVYLMCYSTSSPLIDNGKNSILDLPTFKNYVKHIDSYPMPMDVALPIFSWGIITNHFNKHKLINALTEQDVQNKNFIPLGKHKYKVKEEGFYFGTYLSKGFTIKIESVSKTDLKEVTKFLDTKLPNYSILYFQLDSRFLKNYSL